MTSQRIRWSLMLALLLPPGVTRAQEQGAILLTPWAELKWRTDYNAARKEASDKGLPLVIDFGTTECFWCRKLDETTFRDPRVVALMNERFVPLKVDAEREATLANHLRIESYPTLVLAAPDGKIVAYLKGYQEAESFHSTLQRMLINHRPPEWMQKEFQIALQKIQSGEYALAIPTLRSIVEDGKGRPLQQQAQNYLDAIEKKAQDRIALAREFEEKGRITDAIDSLEDTIRFYPGLESTRQAKSAVERLKEQISPEKILAQRTKRAGELLAQAREFHKQRDVVPCLDRCATLLRDYVDLVEGQQATTIVNDIKSNPLLLQQAADNLSERLGEMYLALAENHLLKNQPQRAEFYFQRVVLACPGSRQAESAQLRLTQLQSRQPPSPAGAASAKNPD